MEPVFLGTTDCYNPEEWNRLKVFWIEAADRHSGHIKRTYKQVALGYEMLLDGRAEVTPEGFRVL